MAEQPKYLQVADILRREIAEGVFRDGQTLMTEEELRVRFGVSRQTVRQAIALLEEDGLVDRRRGSGTYVRHGPRRRQGTPRIGVITTYITDYIFPSVISGIESVLNRQGAVMTLSATYNDRRIERNLLERMIGGQIDGLIIEGSRTAEQTPNEDCFRRLAERNIPVIFMNSYYPSMAPIPHVVMDDYGGGRTAAREILKRGYRRPGAMFKMDDMQGEERCRGFLDEMKEQGVDVPKENLLLFGTENRMDLFETRLGLDFLERMLRERPMDCMACYNDIFAVSLMDLLEKGGMRLPEDMGFIGFDDAIYAAMSRPGLTTLGHPKEAFGSLVAEKLLRMIDGEREDSVRMDWKLVERESLPAAQ